MGLVGCGSALLWQMPIPQPRSAPRSVLGRYRGPAVEIGARALADRNGAERQRALAAERGPRGVVAWLADSFLP